MKVVVEAITKATTQAAMKYATEAAEKVATEAMVLTVLYKKNPNRGSYEVKLHTSVIASPLVYIMIEVWGRQLERSWQLHRSWKRSWLLTSSIMPTFIGRETVTFRHQTLSKAKLQTLPESRLQTLTEVASNLDKGGFESWRKGLRTQQRLDSSGFLDLEGRNNNHKKKKTNESVTVGNKDTNTDLNIEFPTLETSVGKKPNKPIHVTQVPVTESVGSLNDATMYTDVSTKAPNTTNPTIDVVNSRTMSPNQNGGDQDANESDVWLPLTLVHKVNDRMKNSLYGYFIGKRLAFPFASIEGVESVLRNGPWMIREIPIFLTNCPLHSLSLMAMKIGTPIMLDSDHLVMVVPNLEGNGYMKETICIEYEWEPPRCSTCLIFGHLNIDCPKGESKG
ncbi:hypothetical protein Tco_1186493 [Tanacetum coccineum]